MQSPLMVAEDDAFTRGYYNTWNRNKLGITLNLNRPEGIALAKRLVAVSDAVMENFTPRVMSNWGLDYANLKKLKPEHYHGESVGTRGRKVIMAAMVPPSMLYPA